MSSHPRPGLTSTSQSVGLLQLLSDVLFETAVNHGW
uniref:Uncharacterized protein n=1 Tax=Utricularia reniformis TaxID=192314 RepID=A0A1Y0B3T1_9LAMI|nr:hypothetical protein AEK19_MT1954 [Utricularia reniformis]ART32116.1 hypothetical protein AEK19_MT1954 [Utricularia reniformis]